MSRSILDPKFKYTPAIKTDIRTTFAKVRAEGRQSGKKPEGQGHMGRVIKLRPNETPSV